MRASASERPILHSQIPIEDVAGAFDNQLNKDIPEAKLPISLQALQINQCFAKDINTLLHQPAVSNHLSLRQTILPDLAC
jgi:hypothetical protein